MRNIKQWLIALRETPISQATQSECVDFSTNKTQRTSDSEVSGLSVQLNRPTTAFWLSFACSAALLLGTATTSQAQPTTVTITGSPLGVALGCDGDWDPACIVAGVPTPSLNGLVRRTTDGYWVRTFNLTGGIGYQYKVIADAVLNLTNFNNPWKENYGFGGQQDGPNIPLNVPGTGSVPVTFYYNEQTNLIVDSVNTPH